MLLCTILTVLFFKEVKVEYLPPSFTIDQKIDLRMPNNVLFGQADTLNTMAVQLNKNRIVIADDAYQKLLIFDKKGAFIDRIIKRGPGPKEISRIKNYGLSDQYIVVLDYGNPSFYAIYSIDGDFIKKNQVKGTIIENQVPSIFLEKYLITPYSAMSQIEGKKRVAVWDLLTGTRITDISPAAPFLQMLIGVHTVSVDHNSLWVPRAQSRYIDKFDREFNLIATYHLDFIKGNVPKFDPDHYNHLVHKNKTDELIKYYHAESLIPMHVFVSNNFIVTYEMSGLQRSSFSFYDKNGNLLDRIPFDNTRLDGPGDPVGLFDDQLIFYKEAESDKYAGHILFISFKLHSD
ncbi:MAG: hypothetical protein CSA81_02070 [Acidobacteria bacterium]|nr:MAG: hypothetical protein CSA81_02070 [Acidobacteriota bacterium]